MMWHRTVMIFIFGILGLTGCQSTYQTGLTPFADIHLHYNWDHDEYYTPEQAIGDLKKHNVVVAAVSSVPSAMALDLAKAGKGWIVPFYAPYYDAGNRLDWFFDMQVVDKTREALASGDFHGIGEVHLVAGFGPRRDNPVFVGLLELAREYNVPMLIHTDSSSYRYMLGVCESYPDIVFQWAHAGSLLKPEGLTRVMEACPRVWPEMSARDPWHYGDFLNDDGTIPVQWREWFIRYQDRIMVGIDPVSGGHQVYRWYEADEGWKYYARYHQYHRNWLTQLPPEVEEKIRLTNARRFFAYALKKMKQ